MKISIVIPTCKTVYEIAPLMCNLEGFAQGCEIIATCQDASAAVNRNAGLDKATGDIIVMIDDDIAGFYPGWWKDMVSPLMFSDTMLVSARLMNVHGQPGTMMFTGDLGAPSITEVPRVPTACIAFRKADLGGIRFDERFKGSGFEDDDFCAKLSMKFPNSVVVINNKCKMIHTNEMKNQQGAIFEENKALFESIWRTEGARRIPVDVSGPEAVPAVETVTEVPAPVAKVRSRVRKVKGASNERQ